MSLSDNNFGVATGQSVPCRLSAVTRSLAARALSGEHGMGMATADFHINPDFYLTLPTPNQIYAEAVRLIAEKAPLRILPGERIVGSATLLEATWHETPLVKFRSISHTTIGFEKALRIGYHGIRAEIMDKLESGVDEDGEDLLMAMLACLDAAGVWHQRHLDYLEEQVTAVKGEERDAYMQVMTVMRHVPEESPTTFHEALQSLWLLWDFQRLCGNWSGIGRIDKLLGGYLHHDLECGRLTLDEARELLAQFWIKGCEWIRGDGQGSGDAQFYQNVVLGGVDEDGNDVTNEVTYLVLDVVEELHISDFPIAVRISRNSPDLLLQRIAEVQRLGGGIVAIYNDDRIIPSLVHYGYPIEEARNFANDGCWEIIIPGKTNFSYGNIDLVLVLQQILGLSPTETPIIDYPDFTSLYRAFESRLAIHITGSVNNVNINKQPCPLLSMLVDDCIERGRAYYELGPKYTVLSPHASGIPDVANSLLVLQRLVFEERELTLPEFVEILRNDWQGHEELRTRIWNRFEYYGNDSALVDAMVQRVFNSFTDLVGCVPERFGVKRPAGISTFGREMSTFRSHRLAPASGQHKDTILAGNFSPSPGTDRNGPTAVIRSHCSVDFSKLPCGTVLDLKIMPSSLKGEEGITALTALMRTFVELGGIFMQIDVVDSNLLRLAQANPEQYPNLSVRVSGWSARFATLDKEWQELIIVRTEQKM
jgi:pyruvate-formate lyase